LEKRPAWLTPVERKVLSEILGAPNDAIRLGVIWYGDEPAGDPSWGEGVFVDRQS
jgi:hypothetical protein